MLFRMVSNAYIPSLVAFGDVVPNGTKMVPNLAWLIFSLSSTTFSCNIFWLDEHRKIFISKSADFVIFSDITNKMADASDILYTSTALILRLFWGFHQMDIGMNVCVSPTVHFFRFFSNPFSPLRLNLLCLLAAQSSYFSLFFIEAWAIFGGREASVASSVSVLPSKSKARDFLARQACTHVKVPVARSSTKKNKASLL